MSDSFYERINELGAPESACTTDYSRGYNEAIYHCLAIGGEADDTIGALKAVLWMAEEWFKQLGCVSTIADEYEAQIKAARLALGDEERRGAAPQGTSCGADNLKPALPKREVRHDPSQLPRMDRVDHSSHRHQIRR